MLPPSSRATMFGLQTCIFAAANGLAARKARENVWINIAPAISACQVHISHARQHLILRISTTQFVSALHANIISGILYSWPSEDETDKIDITASSDGNTKKKNGKQDKNVSRWWENTINASGMNQPTRTNNIFRTCGGRMGVYRKASVYIIQ